MSFVDGLSSGLDTTSIINQLMQIERLPQNRLVNQRSAERAAQTELKGIRSATSSLGDFAADLRRSTQWQKLSATSTDNSVTPTATAGEFEGSVSFNVTSLATTHTVYSNTLYEDSSTASGGTGSVFSYRDTAVLGISNLEASGLPVGDVSFEVTQATGPAQINGSPIPTIPITIDETVDRLGLEVNGVAYEVPIAHGDYDSEQALANAVTTAIAAHPDLAGVIKAKLSDDDGIQLSTVGEGSAHSIQIVGGVAADALGLTAGPASIGTDGAISVNGQITTINDTASGPITLAAGSGAGAPTITATFSGGIQTGTADVAQVDFGDGSLTDTVNAINSASGLNYTAAAINTGNGYRLQLMSRDTGSDAEISADLGSIAGAGGFSTLTEGTDAVLTVEGTNPYSISSATNSFTDVLPGIDLSVSQVTTDPVTVSISRDTAYVAGKVSELVDQVNSLVGRITNSTKSDPGGTRSVLQGNRSARTASDHIRNAMIRPVDSSSFGSLGAVGIELERDGTLTFDESKFLETLRDDPEEVTRLFAQATGTEGEDGILDRLVSAADGASSFGDGYLYTAAESAGNRIEDFSDQIDKYEIRLELREQSYRRTYANLEVLLGEMQRQSSSLGAQLGSLGGTA